MLHIRCCYILSLQATKLARAMVTKYGMSSVLGPTSIAYEDNGRSLSSETRAAVEQEVSSPLHVLWASSLPAHDLIYVQNDWKYMEFSKRQMSRESARSPH